MIPVLVVEDVAEMRELLGELVRGMTGFSLSGLAANGAEAHFELLRRRPGTVLLDEVLPGESSLDLLEAMAREEIPVVLVTALPDRLSLPLPGGARARVFKPSWKSLEEDRIRIEAALALAIEPRQSRN